MANKVIAELIQKAKAASIMNRGAYPVTIATNVYMQDGSSVESDIQKPDVVVDPSVTPITEVITNVESGAVIAIPEGEVAESLTLDKGVVIQGSNAGVPQNYKQEV